MRRVLKHWGWPGAEIVVFKGHLNERFCGKFGRGSNLLAYLSELDKPWAPEFSAPELSASKTSIPKEPNFKLKLGPNSF